MEKGNKPFKDESVGIKIVVVIAISLLIIVALTFLFSVYYFGILGVFKLLGVSYDSSLSLLLFVLFFFLFSFIGDVIIKVFHHLFSVINRKSFTTMLLIHFLVTWSIISLLTFLMSSIQMSTVTQIVIAFIIAMIEVVLDKDDKK